MKILFNCLTMEKGGAERVVALLANEFVKENEVSILTLKKSKDAYELNEKIKRVCVDKTSYKKDGRVKKVLRKLSFRRFSSIKKIILAEGPDVIVSFLPEPSLRLMFLRKFSFRLRKIPTIISIRNDPECEYKNPLLKFVVKVLYKNVDGMVYQTDDAKKFFENIIKTKNQVIILNPVDGKMLVEPKSDAERKNEIVTVGRLEAQKNHEMLIRAFGETLKNDEHDYALRIYGEGSRREFLQSLIDELDLKERVFLEGQVDNVIEKLNDAKIFVLSSHYEGMPNALIEAMAMGLPCVATDCPCGGPRTLIKNGENGILVKNEDRKVMGEALIKLMKNEEERRRLGKSALLVRDDNGLDKISGLWREFIEKVLKPNDVRKVLFCLGSLDRGGAQRVVTNLSNDFSDKYSVAIVTTKPGKSGYELDKKVRHIALDGYGATSGVLRRTFNRVLKLRKILKNWSPDIAISFLPEPSYRMMLAKSFLPVRTIVSVRNDPNKEYNNLLKRSIMGFLYSRADGFVFQTPDARRWFSEKMQNKSVVIPNPVDEKFLREPYGGEREKRIVTVGRLVPQKNQKLLLKAFREFHEQYDDYVLEIYGDGPLKKELEEYAKKIGIEDNVKFMGEVQDIKSAIYKAKMFVLTSDYEGMPNALMEAMAMGLPCISTNCRIGGPAYLIKDGINGILVKTGNEIALNSAMGRIAEDEKFANEIALSASGSMQNLSLEKIDEKWKVFMREVMNR